MEGGESGRDRRERKRKEGGGTLERGRVRREGDRRGKRIEERGGEKQRREGERKPYTLGYPFLVSFQELLVEQLTNQQLLSSEVEAKKDETKTNI